jgi:chromosome partitioning protein
MNSKGGCGKTTIATNLASFYAARGYRTALFDYDPQASSTSWLDLRPVEQPKIHGIAAYERRPNNLTRSWQLRVPPDIQRVVIDTPAGLDKMQILEYLKGVDIILVPVVPSAIDVRATAHFLSNLRAVSKTSATRIAIVANRIRENALGLQTLERFLTNLDIPVIARLRDTQDYVQVTEHGLGIHELDIYRARFELPHWQNILGWLESQQPSETPQMASV